MYTCDIINKIFHPFPSSAKWFPKNIEAESGINWVSLLTTVLFPTPEEDPQIAITLQIRVEFPIKNSHLMNGLDKPVEIQSQAYIIFLTHHLDPFFEGSLSFSGGISNTNHQDNAGHDRFGTIFASVRLSLSLSLVSCMPRS